MRDNLTLDKLLIAVKDVFFPPFYYATSEAIERGIILLAKKTVHSPEYFACHPDDFEEVKRGIVRRRLVHLRDCPIEKWGIWGIGVKSI